MLTARHSHFIGFLVLVFSISLIYAQSLGFEFINLDDNDYVYQNAHVFAGMTKDGVAWAFGMKDHERTYWHPLTWISHMIDCELFGLDAGMHHLTNVVFHVMNALLLFVVLRLMTAETGKSALVALLFAVHPVNVDTVAWVSERKNLLSTFFWMLSMLWYVYYTRKNSALCYLSAVTAFFLGLLSKPMLVTLPFVLMLLDVWPLKRIRVNDPEGLIHAVREQRAMITRAVAEKLPFLVLSCLSIGVSLVSYSKPPLSTMPHGASLFLKVQNVVVSYATYLYKMVIPHNLTFFYPYPERIGMAVFLASLAFLTGITIAAFLFMKRRPYLLVGWLWFLGTLVPVSGIMQVGLWPALAERWAYVPYIGIFIAVIWGVSDISKNIRYGRLVIVLGMLIVFTAFGVISSRQASIWKNSMTLYMHALAVNPENYVAMVNIGAVLSDRGEVDKALHFFERSLEVNPYLAVSHYNIGNILFDRGKPDQGAAHLEKAISLKPDYVKAYLRLARMYQSQGNIKEAARILSRASSVAPDSTDVLNNLGAAYELLGRTDEAMKVYARIVESGNMNSSTFYNLGFIVMKKGDTEDALRYFSRATAMDPDHEKAHFQLGVLYARQGKDNRAVQQLAEAIRINPQNSEAHYLLAVASLKVDRLDDAILHLRKAMELKGPWDEAQGLLNAAEKKKAQIERLISLTQKGLAQDTGDRKPLMKLARLYNMKGDPETALKYLNMILENEPDDPDVLYNIACVHAKQNRVEESLKSLRAALENGFAHRDLLLTDKDLENIRDSAGFKDILRVYGDAPGH